MVAPAPKPQPKPTPQPKITPAPGTPWPDLSFGCNSVQVISSSRESSIPTKPCLTEDHFFVYFAASSSSPIAVEQKLTTSWIANGKNYYRYSTIVTNKSAKTLTDLKLSISKLYGPIWGLTQSGDSYVFPSWLNSLPAGKSLEFVYIHSASPADVSVSSYTLA